jgi:hypothetical protein
MRVFWDIAPCSLAGVDRCFRGAYYVCHQGGYHHHDWLHSAISQKTPSAHSMPREPQIYFIVYWSCSELLLDGSVWLWVELCAIHLSFTCPGCHLKQGWEVKSRDRFICHYVHKCSNVYRDWYTALRAPYTNPPLFRPSAALNMTSAHMFVTSKLHCKPFVKCDVAVLQYSSTKRHGRIVSTPALYSGGPVFKSWSRDWLSWLSFFVVLLSPCKTNVQTLP